MFNTTLDRLRCPARKKGHQICGSTLSLRADRKVSASLDLPDEVLSGQLECKSCRAKYPILAGVAVLVSDVRGFLFAHVKGVMQAVEAADLPREYARELKEAHEELLSESVHIEDDLEAERVISLYLMNHFLGVRDVGPESRDAWWSPRAGKGSPLIDALVREHWDQGPLARIERCVRDLKDSRKVVELGCGVGGLAPRIASQVDCYLGVDSSFAAIALARHLALGAPYRGKVRIPEDLLAGPVSREIQIPEPPAHMRTGVADFVVGDLEAAPISRGEWDVTIALNAIDMLEEPSRLPELQRDLLRDGGVAIQSCPYIWHESVAKKLRSRLPKQVRDSASAVEWLYGRAGFEIESRQDHVPWLFFKHVRQLEIYSVHLFLARKGARGVG